MNSPRLLKTLDDVASFYFETQIRGNRLWDFCIAKQLYEACVTDSEDTFCMVCRRLIHNTNIDPLIQASVCYDCFRLVSNKANYDYWATIHVRHKASSIRTKISESILREAREVLEREHGIFPSSSSS